MELFPLQKDVQAFLLRAAASLERVDSTVAEAQILIRDLDSTVNDFRRMLKAFQTAVGSSAEGK